MTFDIVPGDEGPDARRDAAGGAGPDAPQVGEFRQGGRLTDAMLRQYLLLRVLGASIQRTLQVFGIVIIGGAGAIWAGGHQIIAVLVGLVGVGWLLVARLLAAIISRVSGAHRLGPDEAKVDDLIRQTRKGLRSEFKRVDLPSGPWGEFRVGVRLVRPVARVSTLRKLSAVKLESVVSSSRLDELHLLLRNRTR